MYLLWNSKDLFLERNKKKNVNALIMYNTFKVILFCLWMFVAEKNKENT